MRAARRTARRLALAATAAVLVVSAAACSDDGGDGSTDQSGAGPTAASTEDFCGTFNGLLATLMTEAGGGEPAEMIRAVKEWAADMEEVGPPVDMPEDARRGFDTFVDRAEQLDENADLQELQRLTDALTAQDEADGSGCARTAPSTCRHARGRP